jgi:hypothetical protein
MLVAPSTAIDLDGLIQDWRACTKQRKVFMGVLRMASGFPCNILGSRLPLYRP